MNSHREIRRLAREFYIRERTEAIDKCGYCGTPIVWSELINDAVFMTKGPDRIIWINKQGRRMDFKTATIEHIKPLCKGGGNLLHNLMGSCHDCNNVRSKPQRPQTGFRSAEQLWGQR